MSQSATNRGSEVDLLLGVSANDLADGKRADPGRGQIDCPDQAVETAR
jgi:hypothetical protein